MVPARPPTSQQPSVDEIADELYSLAPQDFIGRRDEIAGAAKAGGDRETGKAVSALRKPSTSAWLANQLVRSHRDDVTALLELGDALRQAQSRLDGDQLRELSRRRRQAVNALVHQGRALAVELGRPVGDEIGRELEQTLEAALAAPDAAAQFGSGRLTTTLSSSVGFDAGTASEPQLRVVRDVRPDHDERGRRAAAAKKRLTEASASARGAAQELAERAGAHEALVGQIESLTSRVSQLSTQLRDLEEQVGAAKRQEQQARRALTQAERAAHRADLVLEAARADLER